MDIDASRIFDLNLISLIDLLVMIEEALLKQHSLDPLPMWLLKDSAIGLGPYILRIIHSSLSLDWSIPSCLLSSRKQVSIWHHQTIYQLQTCLSFQRVWNLSYTNRWPTIYFGTTFSWSFSQFTSTVISLRPHLLKVFPSIVDAMDQAILYSFPSWTCPQHFIWWIMASSDNV